MRIPQGRAYDEVSVGDEFDYVLTITETHLVTAAGLFGDFNPLHVDETFASQSRFGGRILHGPFTSAFVAAPVGIYFSGTAIAYLEHSCRFLAPVKPGDTLRALWTVTDMADKARFQGGVIGLSCSCSNQQDVEVASAAGKIMVATRASTGDESDE
ncbi:MAG: MaoC family dehydratase [Arenicellales bacterium]|nr:MaoC family dehydratase [Arenicellales bacterium]MDP6552481.1 MaoC family dehydratase [Arenicellales bacterium]MDP6853884.1 MaoC family dehydratase [Arenicellales bacterium]MDP6919620.1 MaoC family dehydratase [Arenicellales bacterium]